MSWFSIAGDESVMAELLFSSVVAFIALVLVAFAVAAVRRYPPVGIGLVCLVLFTVWDVPTPSPIITVSGLSVYPADAIAVVLLVVAIFEVPQLRENMRAWLVAWVFFGVLIVVSLLRGVLVFGAGTAVTDARPLVHFFCAMTWVLAVRPDRLRIQTVSLVVGWVLVLVSVYHGVSYGVGGTKSVASLYEDVTQTGRVLYGGQAAALLFCAATILLSPRGSARVRPQFAAASSFVFLGLVVLAQHRSVWGAGVIAIAAVLIWSGQRQARNRVAVALIVGTWLGLVVWSSGIFEKSGSGLFESALDMGTYEWRTSSWQSLTSEAFAKGSEVVVGGQPFGSGYLRQLNTGRWTERGAHNWYVTNFLRLGVIGLVTLAWMSIAALAKSRSRPAWTTFVLAAAGAYSWAYSFDWYLAPWLGAAIALSLGDSDGRPAAGVDQVALGISGEGEVKARSVGGAQKSEV